VTIVVSGEGTQKAGSCKAYTRGKKIYVHSLYDRTLSSTLTSNLKQNVQSAKAT